MSEPLRGVVVSHAGLAQALVDAVARITGRAEGLVAVSNEGCDREALERHVAEAVGDGPAVVFVDLPSGSCLLASARYLRTNPGVAVVAGVNLPMLVDFVYHRDAAAAAAAERAVAIGGRALKVVGA
jgi:mannose/fructose-specific phosphotransferase system component IIA